MSFILSRPDRAVLGTAPTRAQAAWFTREYHEMFDYAFAIVFPTRESAEDACAARGDGATVERLPEDL